MKNAISLSFVLLVTSAMAQPFPSFVVDTLPCYGPNLRCGEPAIAWAGDTGMVVWYCGGMVRGVMFDTALSTLNPVPFAVGGFHAQGTSGEGAAIAASDDGFMAMWLEGSDITAAVHSGGRLYPPVEVGRADCWGFDASSDGDRFLAVWSNMYYPSSYVEFAELNETGVVERTGIVAADLCPPSYVYNARAAYGQDRYLVAWDRCNESTHRHEVYGRLFRPDSVGADTVGFRICSDSSSWLHSVSYDGRNFIVGWLDGEEDTSTFRLTRVAPDGTVLDSAGIVVHGDSAGYYRVASRNDTTMVSWINQEHEPWSLLARRMTGNGLLLDTIDLVIHQASSIRDPWLATMGDGLVLAWSQRADARRPDEGSTIAGFRIGLDGVPRDTAPILLSNSANSQFSPAVASDGHDFLVVWSDLRADSGAWFQVRGMRLGPEGTRLDESPFAISPPCSLPHRTAVAYGGGCYLVCWEDWDKYAAQNEHNGDIRAARVSTEGVLLDTVPLTLESGWRHSRRPVVAYAEGLFLLVCECEARLGAVRVTPAGEVLDSVPITFWLGATSDHRPSLASDGSAFFLTAWDGGIARLYAGVLDTAVRVLAENLLLYPASPHGDCRTKVCLGDSICFVVGGAWDLAWRLGRDGSILDTIRVLSNNRMGERYAATFDGTNFLTVAVDYPRYRSVNGMRVSTCGILLDDEPISIAEPDSAYMDDICATVADSTGNVAVVFVTVEPVRYMSTRIRACVFPTMSGVGEEPGPRWAARSPCPTFVRDVLSFRGQHPAILLDISGRKVMDLQPGQNDIRHIAPGVYFLRSAESGERSAVSVRKVVIQK